MTEASSARNPIVEYDRSPDEQGYHHLRGHFGRYAITGASVHYAEVTAHITDMSTEPPRAVGSVRLHILSSPDRGMAEIANIIRADIADSVDGSLSA